MFKIEVLKFKFLTIVWIALTLFVAPVSAIAHPFLWKATGEHTFYLLGTIHLPDPRITNIPPEVTAALKDSTAFYAELDLSESNIVEIAQFMWLPEGQTLYDLLSKKIQTQISTVLTNIHPEISLEMFSNQKIWALAVTLTLLEQQIKYPGQPPLDILLFELASKQGKITGGLETIHEQLDIFERLNEEEQIKLLTDTLMFLEEAQNQNTSIAEQSIDAYIQGDLAKLMELLTSYMKDEPFYNALLKKLMDDRNVKMTEEILFLVNQNPDQKFFFAIGAGHFWGEQSISKLLTENGYTLQVVDQH